MTLAQKISMCLALWNPDVTMHSASEGLLSHWYNQQMEFIRQEIDGEELHVSDKPYLSWSEFSQLFSLPNSDYIRIPICIQQDSKVS